MPSLTTFPQLEMATLGYANLRYDYAQCAASRQKYLVVVIASSCGKSTERQAVGATDQLVLAKPI
jgi:hypothetical protein